MTKENPHSLSLFLRYSRTCPLLLSAYLFLAPLSALVEIGLAAAIAAAVDYALSGTLENIGAYIVVYLGYVLLELLVGYGCKRLRFSILSRMTQALKDDLHGAILAMPYMQFREGNSAAYLAELTDHAESVRNSYFSIFLSLYPEALQFAVAGAAMLWISPLLGGYIMKLRRLFSFVLALTLVMGCIPLLASAETVNTSPISPVAPAGLQMSCPKCGSSSVTVLKVWTEYNYYYTRVWYTMQCDSCGTTWNTSQDINNITRSVPVRDPS